MSQIQQILYFKIVLKELNDSEFFANPFKEQRFVPVAKKV